MGKAPVFWRLHSRVGGYLTSALPNNNALLYWGSKCEKKP